MKISTALLLGALLAPASAGAAQDPTRTSARPGEPTPPKTVEAVRIEGASPRLDGRLDDPVWRRAPAATGFVQREPTEGAPAPERTEVRFAYDDDALWIAARMHSDAPRTIRPIVARRDREVASEQLVVSLDTYHDRRTAYTFAVTPAGGRIDYHHPGDFEGARDYGFDPVWEVETRIDSLGWTAEIRVPLTQLRFTLPGPAEDDGTTVGGTGARAGAAAIGRTGPAEMVWGANLVRRVPRRNEVSYWVLVGRDETGWASRMGVLTGLDGVRPSGRLELLPYVAAGADFTGTVAAGDPFTEERTADVGVGVDLKMGVGSNLTLDATINPDFGQVDADPAEVNLTAYETFFPERRPFFTEGAQLFGGRGLFYSRRIGAPPPGRPDADFHEPAGNTTILGAAKLTGRLRSGLSVAALAALTDREEVATYDAGADAFGTAVVAPRTGYAVASVQQEFGADGSTLSALVTAVERDLEPGDPLAAVVPRSAYSGIVDGRYRWAGGRYDMSAYVAFTHVRGDSAAILGLQRSPRRYWQRPGADHVGIDPGRESLSGTHIGINHSKLAGEHWLWNVDLFQHSPGYEPNDIGAQGAVDDRVVTANVIYRETEPGRWTRNWFVGLAQFTEWNVDGLHRVTVLAPFINFTLPNFWRINLDGELLTRGLSDRLTRGGPVMGRYREWGGRIELRNSGGARNRWGVELGLDADELGGSLRQVEGSLSVRPGSRWEISLDPRWTRRVDPRQYVATVDGGRAATFGRRYIFARVRRDEVALRVRLNYTFTPHLTLETYAEPFASSGRFSRFGELEAPRSRDLIEYGTGGTNVTVHDDGSRTVAAGGDAFTLPAQDFNVRSFRSNVVLRWRWRSGSTLYLVWQQDRFAARSPGEVRPDALWDALGAGGDQFLALKIDYWLPVR